jgi:hypothetical protein
MTVEGFIESQQEVIAESGVEAYLPTVWVETRRAVHVSVLVDPPPDDEVEPLAKDWALHVAKRKHDYLLSFKVDDRHIKVVSRLGGTTTERLVSVEVR